MSKKPVVAIEHVSKLFRQQKQRTFKEMLPALVTGGRQSVVATFWALQDVSLKIYPGEVFGIISPNGSGKSTLLKLIAKVTLPTKGNVSVKGRLTPLLELGAGFHPDMTGRENIYLNAVILGLTKTEIEPLVEQIIDFSEINDFVDQPVKHYSSGMYSRLAFSVAIHIPFEILLVDEILGVGDAKFQAKCFARMENFKKQGKTIVYVGHNLDRGASFCDRAAYLCQGHLKKVGTPAEIIEAYQKDYHFAR